MIYFLINRYKNDKSSRLRKHDFDSQDTKVSTMLNLYANSNMASGLLKGKKIKAISLFHVIFIEKQLKELIKILENCQFFKNEDENLNFEGKDMVDEDKMYTNRVGLANWKD